MKKWDIKDVPKAFQFVLNSSLIIVGLLLVILLCKEVYFLFHLLFFSEGNDAKEFFKSILTFFLYFEFIAMIVKYFQEDYHFPLRYFMYIGITATVRLIVVDHEEGLETLFFSASILCLVISYGILTYRKKK